MRWVPDSAQERQDDQERAEARPQLHLQTQLAHRYVSESQIVRNHCRSEPCSKMSGTDRYAAQEIYRPLRVSTLAAAWPQEHIADEVK